MGTSGKHKKAVFIQMNVTFQVYRLLDATAGLIFKELYYLLTLYLCVLYLSQNKQRLLPPYNVTHWFL
jgi:hypothetical protein